MRQVRLDGTRPMEAGPLRDKLTGHLLARLREYGEEGITARLLSPGRVSLSVAGHSPAAVLSALEERGVYGRMGEEGAELIPGEGVSFEDLDYVQGAAAALL